MSTGECTKGFLNNDFKPHVHNLSKLSGFNLEPQWLSNNQHMKTSIEHGKNDLVTDRFSDSLTARRISNLPGENLLSRRNPADETFRSRIRSLKRPNVSSSRTSDRLVHTLPLLNITNYSRGNILFKSNSNRENSSSLRCAKQNDSSTNRSSKLSTTNDTSLAHYSGGNILLTRLPTKHYSMRKKDDQNNYSNDECEKSYGIWQNKSNTDEDWSTTRSTGRSGYPNSRSLLQLNSVETRLEPNLTLDSIHNDLSFRNVYCSTPKHLKVCEFANGMNRMNTEETPYHHLQIDFLDSEYEPGDLNSEYDEFEDGGIDDEGLYNIIGDVEPMTNFSMDEYFEKYRNRIISDNE
ncbi:uncharacterized protein LOC129722303 [Wyeomyia smithii]|uniref:uncharacterized protein LOC129722303 n=1 Tax=Wyeomyia smithii TaxID=174621 RepID=UPI002467F311|nr:uncharacterized protein LOC129722303 [Wyeomyia smithii]